MEVLKITDYVAVNKDLLIHSYDSGSHHFVLSVPRTSHRIHYPVCSKMFNYIQPGEKAYFLPDNFAKDYYAVREGDKTRYYRYVNSKDSLRAEFKAKCTPIKVRKVPMVGKHYTKEILTIPTTFSDFPFTGILYYEPVNDNEVRYGKMEVVPYRYPLIADVETYINSYIFAGSLVGTIIRIFTLHEDIVTYHNEYAAERNREALGYDFKDMENTFVVITEHDDKEITIPIELISSLPY